MGITIRKASPSDAGEMAHLLNEIIAIGGTTAFLNPVSAEMIQGWMLKDGDGAVWLVAVDELGGIVGYQSAEPHSKLPSDAANIASFVKVGVVGGGIGTKLFAETKRTLRELGKTWVNASIRSDNASGLSYYNKMGFQDWKVEPEAQLSDGRVCGKHHKRFNL